MDFSELPTMNWEWIEMTCSPRDDPSIENLVRKAFRDNQDVYACRDLRGAGHSPSGSLTRRNLCVELFECVRLDPRRHFERLDQALKRYLRCVPVNAEPDLAMVVDVLSRLPITPASML